jgi:hypothetical protein
MKTQIEITQSIKNSYDSFVKYMMKSTNLPFSEMQSLEGWVSNRYKDFTEDSFAIRLQGFECWLSKKYN